MRSYTVRITMHFRKCNTYIKVAETNDGLRCFALFCAVFTHVSASTHKCSACIKGSAEQLTKGDQLKTPALCLLNNVRKGMNCS